MAIATLNGILEDARKNHYAVGMFDVHNLEMVKAVIEAAELERAPVILALAEVHIQSARQMEYIGNIMVHAAHHARYPVAVHLDHSASAETMIRALHLGFSSVMYDGSQLPLEENIRLTARAVKLAKIFGASVEAELGHVGGSEGQEDGPDDGFLTDPDQAAQFAGQTGVDALAVSIGTVHGVYRKKPELNLELLGRISDRVSIPLVLHGGSGLGDQDFRNCIAGGIAKINIYTELVQAAQRALAETASDRSFPQQMEYCEEAIREVVRTKIRLFGSAGINQ